ncbi:hypothetical protein [Clostridium celatum]|uniref:hypothetical protein n=1 Tax=Clostridium celatum TaxID=36834 RepID=UPI00291254FC|nr:hypothetical protein [Clostridium celatum]
MKHIIYIIYIEDDLQKKKNIYYSEDKEEADLKFNTLLNICIMKVRESISIRGNDCISKNDDFKLISLSNKEKILIRSKDFVVYVNEKGKIVGSISFINNFNHTYNERVIMEII